MKKCENIYIMIYDANISMNKNICLSKLRVDKFYSFLIVYLIIEESNINVIAFKIKDKFFTKFQTVDKLNQNINFQTH